MSKSQQRGIFSLFIFSICYGIITAANSPCGDWEPYKDEKCIKIFDETRTYDDAIKTCQQQENSSTLVSIRSLEEQEFFSNLLFKTHKVVDTVWIGAKYSSIKFKWSDDTDVSFTNWAQGSPSNTTDKACVQMIPDGSSIGKWADEPCNKKNLIVCQKMQTWSLPRLQQTLLDARKEFRDAFNNLQHNPVPIGFIYVQLPSQPEPSNLWPSVKWQHVSSNYAGHFFRVEGGKSAPFGESQLDAFQGHFHGIAAHQQAGGGGGVGTAWLDRNYPHYSVWEPVTDGKNGDPRTASETRPINYSVRIWKRVS